MHEVLHLVHEAPHAGIDSTGEVEEDVGIGFEVVDDVLGWSSEGGDVSDALEVVGVGGLINGPIHGEK